MATKKELDDMLDNLRNPSSAKKKTTKPAVKDKLDNASLDDILDVLSEENSAKPAETPKTRARKENSNEVTKVFDKKPVSDFDRKFGKKIKPIPDTPVERPVYPSDEEPSPVKKKKMKIVISGDLPDYEAIRQQELAKDRAAKEAEEARKAEENAAQEARAAAEKIAEKRKLDEQKAAEEAEKAALERQRLAEERAKEEARIAEKKRLAEERAKEEARIAEERKRLAEERAAEEARIAEEKKRLAEERAEAEARLAEKKKRLAEEKARLEAEEAAMEAEEAAVEAEAEAVTTVSEEEALMALAEADDKAAEDIPVPTIDDDYDIEEVKEPERDELDEAIEALGAAAAHPRTYDEDDLDDDFKPKKRSSGGKKKGFFAKIKEMFSGDVFDEDEQEKFAEKPSDTELVDKEDAAMFEQEDTSESDELVNAAMAAINDEPVVSAAEDVAEEAEDTLEAAEEKAEEYKAELEEAAEEAEETVSEAVVSEEDDFSIEEVAEDEDVEEVLEEKEKSTLEAILDEDPEELVKAQTEQSEIGRPHRLMGEIKAKRRKYAVLGILCAVLALIGLIAIITSGVNMLRNIGNANDKKDRFTHVIYPAAIMDIDPFNNPTELSSEQIITATLWSIIMDKNKIGNYESKLGDTVSIPDVDVEKYAVELFGENIPAFEHCTVGPVEARFYYSDGAYNVKLKPITFTYAPNVRSVEKSGNKYTLTVDYIDELPEWMPKSVAKTAEYQLTEQNDGSYIIDSMRIISVKTSDL